MRNVEDIDVWNFRQERFMLRHLRQWSKNFGFGSALSHNSGAANTILFTIQTFNEHSRMAKLSQPYLRGHMRWNVTSLQVQLGIIETYNFWTPVNFEVEYFINEETEGALTDTVTYFSDQHLTWLSQLKPNAKLG